MLELAGIIILGILAQWVAWKFKIPAILPLILIGLLVGPIAAAYLSEDGSKWIEREQLLFKSTDFGDDKDRALQKADKSWTYFASDVA